MKRIRVRPAVTDLQDTPPVPPEDHGGDERIGWWVAGTLCLLGGWVGAVVLNLYLHHVAPAGGSRFGPVWIGPTMGPFAWTVFAGGVGAGLFGVVLCYLASRAPRGRFVLPGQPY